MFLEFLQGGGTSSWSATFATILTASFTAANLRISCFVSQKDSRCHGKNCQTKVTNDSQIKSRSDSKLEGFDYLQAVDLEVGFPKLLERARVLGALIGWTSQACTPHWTLLKN